MVLSDHTEFFQFLKFAPDELLFDYFHSTYTVQVLALVHTAMVAIVIHEYFTHLIAELRTWKLLLEGRFMPARMAVIIIRYAWIGAFVNAEIFMHGSPKAKACIIHFRLVYGLYCILWASSGSIFLMRLNIIFSRQRSIMAGYIALWLLGLGCWIFVVTRLSAEPLPRMLYQPYGPRCITKRFPRIGALGWGASIMFDSSVFLGTLYRFHVTAKAQDKTTQLRSRKWLFRSNLYYFGSSMFFNIACLLSNLFVDDIVLSQVGTPIAFAMHTVTASRLVFNAKGWARGDTLGDEDDVILNTFHKHRRDNPISRIMYTVDETVITSAGGLEGAAEAHKGEKIDDEVGSDTSRGKDGRDSGSDHMGDMEDGMFHGHCFYDSEVAHRAGASLSQKDGEDVDANAKTMTPTTKLREMPEFQHVKISSPADIVRYQDVSGTAPPQGYAPHGTAYTDEPLTVCAPFPPSYSCAAGPQYDDGRGEHAARTAENCQHPYSNPAPPRSPRAFELPPSAHSPPTRSSSAGGDGWSGRNSCAGWQCTTQEPPIPSILVRPSSASQNGTSASHTLLGTEGSEGSPRSLDHHSKDDDQRREFPTRPA